MAQKTKDIQNTNICDEVKWFSLKKKKDCTQGSLDVNQFILLVCAFLNMQKCDRVSKLSLNKSNTAPGVSRKLLFLVIKISTIT